MANKYQAGDRVGAWTVIRKDSPIGTNGYYVCECVCGRRKSLSTANLISGKTRSCGCQRNHGMAETRIYHIWEGMVQRCCNSNSKDWPFYGGRGIVMCPEWKNSFQKFFADMGGSYKDDLTIERINNDGDYCLENCVWATRAQQANNRHDRR